MDLENSLDEILFGTMEISTLSEILNSGSMETTFPQCSPGFEDPHLKNRRYKRSLVCGRCSTFMYALRPASTTTTQVSPSAASTLPYSGCQPVLPASRASRNVLSVPSSACATITPGEGEECGGVGQGDVEVIVRTYPASHN
ncbi:hypothetical protein M378DRAFT_950900 [Amanita muscaria Koide BX008]|uniref:Uncharacterized protein n=1 Tax=Amanita muscaria (strain Koide BX008) TaxID=946122 RepID=A0A0C2WFK1_AMAMK|nr:hypothetical protein M378DRAFT_950900 [Amanita muscaria Koide BX008]